MPVYAYLCKNCGHAFDVRQSFSDDALKECPVCHENSLRKKFDTVGVVFKGPGFYSTDSHGGSSAVEGPAPSGDGSGTSEGTGGSAGPGASAAAAKKPTDSAPTSSPAAGGAASGGSAD